MLTIRLLGELQVLASGQQTLTLPPSKKTRALLAYLAVTGRPQRRERLCDLFWDVPDDPRGALRWSLSRLRSILDEPGSTCLLTDRETVAMNPGMFTVDLLTIQNNLAPGVDAACTEELVQAASAFGGEVLADLDLPHPQTYRSWVAALREDARQLRSRILNTLSVRLADVPDQALPYARDLVDMDSLDEAAWAQLVRLLAAAGRRREAEEQHETATETLKQVGGPSGPLLKAWREIRGGQTARTAVQDQVYGPGQAVSAPDTIREDVPEPAPGLPPQPVEERPQEPLARAPAVAKAAERKPSIAVLPFVNLSRQPDTEYFSYGLTEDIIRLLARHRWLVVLSRHSGAAYKGRELDPREIANALGVRYLMQGTVLRRGERVRLTADLVCGDTGRHLWSDSYDLALPDILEVQDAMAQQIAAVIEPELARIERETAIQKPPARNLDAWDCYQRGLWHLWGFSKPGFVEAEAMFGRAMELEPEFARAHGALAYVKIQSAALSAPLERQAMLRSAMRMARTPAALDDRDCMNQCVLGRALCVHGNFDEAIPALQRSISLNPSFAQGYFALGYALVWAGREEEAIALLERATELSPNDPHLWTFHHARALAHFSLNEIEAAAEWARQASRLPNATHSPQATLVASFALLGRMAEAKTAAAGLFTREPDYDQERARADLQLAREEFIARYLEGLRRAGVPESASPSRPQALSVARTQTRKATVLPQARPT